MNTTSLFWRKSRSFLFKCFARAPLPDKIFYQLVFRLYHGRALDWENPKSFNEFVMLRKLVDRSDLHTMLADKFEVRKFVSNKGYAHLLIPLIAVIDRDGELDLNSLPNSFVIKASHDSGSARVVGDKRNTELVANAVQSVKAALQRNYYSKTREWHYKNIKPRILIETLLTDEAGSIPLDYKLYCISGIVQFIHVVASDHVSGALFDKNWRKLPFMYKSKPFRGELKPPESLPVLIEAAEALSQDLHFARVDLYDVGGKPYFGEITLTPNGGLAEFDPIEFDFRFGDEIIKSGFHLRPEHM